MKATSAAGMVASSLRYDAWGDVEQGTPDVYAYTGREWDPETSLYAYRARYYDPNIGRFLSEDPMGLGAGSNLYVYVDNSPANFTDPLGLVKTSGCTAAKAQAINDAVNDANKKLKDDCACGGGGSASGSAGSGGGTGQRLAKIIDSATYVCKPNMKDCGQGRLRPFGNRIYIGGPGFQPNVCGPLACTIIHEATHRTQWFFSKKKEDKAQDMEKQCCGM